jgi:hypothetical protein
MKVDRRKGSTSVPIWTVVSMLALLAFGMGGVYYGWAQQIARADFIKMQEQIRGFENEFKSVHEINFSNTSAISDIKSEVIPALKTDLAVVKEQTRQILELVRQSR